TSEGVLVQGDLTTSLLDACSRCLTDIELNFSFELEELFATNFQLGSPFRIGEDGILDLAPLMREEVFLALPRQTLCKPDCQGLCPTCGVNRNETSCTCEANDVDPRWTILSSLQKQLSQNDD